MSYFLGFDQVLYIWLVPINTQSKDDKFTHHSSDFHLLNENISSLRDMKSSYLSDLLSLRLPAPDLLSLQTSRCLFRYGFVWLVQVDQHYRLSLESECEDAEK